MNTKVDVFLGAPIEVESERRFLHALCGDLQARHQDALVLANFLLPPQKPIQQIDYLVISERLVCHIELTNLTAPVIGRVNGTWHLVLPDGTKKLHGNKYRQALDCKYRISDQMHCFARQHAAIVEPLNGVKFYRHIDSVVCVYPELMAGSRVPSDKFVRVQGYSDLLHHFANAEGKPAWSSNDWLLFAMELGLVRQDDFTQLPAESVAAAAELVDAYCQRFRDYYKRLTKRLVPTTLESGGAKTNSDECFGFLTMGRHGQLVGPSGSGKSLHAQHMALQSIDAGRVPIVVRAVHYAGKLSLLLDRSVAHLCPRTAVDFIECVRRLGKSLVLVVDGFNECPLRLQETLLRDLQSVFLRWEIPMVITTQEEISLPANLSGEVLRFCDLTEHERRAILVEHAQKELRPDIDNLSRPFQSAYELSLAAACLENLGPNPTRSGLFDAYLRCRCGDSVDSALARRLLCEVADVMRSRLQSSLPVDELWRIGEQVLDDQQAPLMALQDVIECGLIEVRQGQCVFRHELLQRYFEAMALARGSTTLLDLTESLRKPANHALIEFVLEMQCGAAGVRACLQAAAVAPSMSRLFAACLQGRFGEIARTVVIRDAGQLLRQAESDLLLIQIDVKRDESITEVEIRGGKEWTAYEHAVMNALSDSLPAGLFLEEVLHLIAETEHRCINLLETSLGAEKVNRRSFRSNLFWRLFVIGQASRSLPAAAILRAIDGRVTPDVLPSVIERVQNHLGQIDGLSYAQIYLLLTIMRYHAMPKEEDIPQIIRHCWNTGIYHLQLKLLDCVGIWGGRQGDDDSMSGPTRSCVADILSGLHTQNVFLRTLLFETMMVYNLIEPPVDPTLLRGELNNILGRPDDPDAQAAAYAAVSNMFEPLVADVYFPAIENFPRTDRTKLFTMAALGSPPYSMCVDFILSELLKENDRSTIPAFQRFTSHLDGESCFPQDVAASFIVGHAGCSRYLDTPPQLADYSTDDHRAWQCYGEIIFWSQKPGLPKDKIIGRCKPLWHTLQNELAFEAVDPLWRLADADGNSPHSGAHEPVQHVFILCRHEIQKILEFGMKHRYRLSSIDKWFSAFALARYLTTFMIHTLGQIGDAHTTSLLFPLVNDDYHGPDAVDAIRCINSGHQTKRITVLRRCP